MYNKKGEGKEEEEERERGEGGGEDNKNDVLSVILKNIGEWLDSASLSRRRDTGTRSGRTISAGQKHS